MARSLIMLAGLGVASSFMVGSAPSTTRVAARPTKASGIVMMGDILSTASMLEGPVIFWGADGPAVGKEESDIKGTDNFGKFVAAVQACGMADTLRGAGPFTVFVPTDAAMDEFKGQITPDILKYHIVPGKVPVSSIGADLQTLQGSSLTYGRRFRKTFLDYAMVGIVSSGPSKGQVYPVDVDCTNGYIHAIDTVLVPGSYQG